MKKLMLVLAMGALVASGAFAQLMFGASAVQYFNDDSVSVQDAWNNLQDGVGVYYGGFVEIVGRRMGLGASFNFSPDQADVPQALKQMDYDVNVYLSYHLFGGRAIIDPFLNFGIGMRAWGYQDGQAAKDYYKSNWYLNDLNENGYLDKYIDKDDPMAASLYWDFSVGIGINLGLIGVFVKASYVMPLDGIVKGTYDDDVSDYDIWYYNYNVVPGGEYDIPAWVTNNFKWTFGAKIIL